MATPKLYFDPTKSFILVGGTGLCGLEIADWLIRNGARKLVLNSRKGIRNGYQAYCLEKWSQWKGTVVKVSRDDAITMEGTEALVAKAMELGPVEGKYWLTKFLCYYKVCSKNGPAFTDFLFSLLFIIRPKNITQKYPNIYRVFYN